MQYQVLVQKPSERHFVASIVGWSNVVADGKTEEEAIAKIKAALTAQLATSKFVTIEVDSEPETASGADETQTNPWLKHFGIFADDPTFDDFLEEVAAYRKSVDEETLI